MATDPWVDYKENLMLSRVITGTTCCFPGVSGVQAASVDTRQSKKKSNIKRATKKKKDCRSCSTEHKDWAQGQGPLIRGGL